MIEYPVGTADRSRSDHEQIDVVQSASASKAPSNDLQSLHSCQRELAGQIPWSLVRRTLLTFVAIYLIGGAIMFNVQLLEFLGWATPFTIGGAALLIAFLAKLIIREEF